MPLVTRNGTLFLDSTPNYKKPTLLLEHESKSADQNSKDHLQKSRQAPHFFSSFSPCFLISSLICKTLPACSALALAIASCLLES